MRRGLERWRPPKGTPGVSHVGKRLAISDWSQAASDLSQRRWRGNHPTGHGVGGSHCRQLSWRHRLGPDDQRAIDKERSPDASAVDDAVATTLEIDNVNVANVV